jgi:histidinol-phosphate aminotransferase
MPTLSRRQFASTLGAGLSLLARPSHAAAQVTAPTAPAPPPAPPTAPSATAAPGSAALIGLDSNENPYGPSPRALAAMTRAQATASARYPDAKELQLMEALGRHHRVQPEQVVLGCGSGEVIKMADAAFLAPGQTVVVAEPTFEAVLGYAQLSRAEAVKVPLTPDHRHDLRKMAEACSSRTGLVYVCNPNNPTGTIVSGAELQAFLHKVPTETVVLVDEAYHHFVEDPSYRTAFEALPLHENLVVVRTFSKIYGLAGMRLGYAVASKEKAAAMRAQGIWSNANAGVLEAALECLAEPEHFDKVRLAMNGTRHWLVAELEKEGRRTIPSETNFVMIRVGSDVGSLVDAFKVRGIKVGRRFPALPDWLRISIGTDEETRAFLTALRELVPVRPA